MNVLAKRSFDAIGIRSISSAASISGRTRILGAGLRRCAANGSIFTAHAVSKHTGAAIPLI
jgi:hypothetical protein